MKRLIKIFLIISLFLLSLPFFLRFYWSYREDNQIAKGVRIAKGLGCFNCHFPVGGKELPNPNSRFGNVPSFSGGSAMMYAKEEEDLREYILNGYPERKKKEKSYESYLKAPFHMPPFKKHLSSAKTDALIAFVKSASNWEPPQDEKTLLGLNTAIKWGCFTCHGFGGSGGIKNKGSFKGYIPGFLGHDFKELVKSDNEIREWILEGKIKRFDKNPVAKYFIKRQAISMPSFKRVLSGEEIDALIQYIHHLRRVQ